MKSESALMQSLRNFCLILICAFLGACAAMQKSSTGSGDQAPAPISEAGTPSANSANAASAGADSQRNPVRTGSPTDPTGAGGSASQDAAKSAAGLSKEEEAAQLKRKLADQDAQINSLRIEQEALAEREEAAAAAKLREQQAGGGDSGAAGNAARSGGQDELAVFPADGNAARDGAEAAVQRALEHSVYFGYNQASVPEEYDAMLMANAEYLKAHPAVETEVQGNCDERGSREYNLALGARRAEAVKRALELAGADGSRIRTVSFGAEKPVAEGKDEESYSQNRRVDIVY